MEHAPEEPKHYLVQRIREALAHDPRVAEIELQVTVRGNKVFVAGSVPTEDRRQAVADVVKEAGPDLEVHNQTKVMLLPGEVEEENLS